MVVIVKAELLSQKNNANKNALYDKKINKSDFGLCFLKNKNTDKLRLQARFIKDCSIVEEMFL